MSFPLSAEHEGRLARFARALVNQSAARVIVPAQQASPGFWFGGGNLIDQGQGNLLLVGRYRNFGDSRTGVHAGERGLELALFRSTDRGRTFEKLLSLSKADLNVAGQQVLSIEGSAIRRTPAGLELFVSTEKSGIGYPPQWSDYLKPGTGVWTIDHLSAASVEEFRSAAIRTVVTGPDPQYLHVKDPFVYEEPDGGMTLGYCTHPFSWSSSNTAIARREPGGESIGRHDYTCFPRGFTWDVAVTRATCMVDVPPVGPFAERRLTLVFYDGAESLRDLPQHQQSIRRPRGYSCEEIGGVAYLVDGDWRTITRLSRYEAWFLSPQGTGCSRYVDVHPADDGFYATWQQSQADQSQPLVMHRLAREAAEDLLG
jgi:hypothetical protein